jgi:hypothetical protein
MTYSTAQAYVLTMVSPISQSDANSQMTAASAAITTFAGNPPASRAASWYINDAPFRDALPFAQPAPGLPSVSGNDGDVLTTDGTPTGLAWGSGGSGLSMAVFGSTPNVDGGTIASNTLELEPADATNPGGVSTAAQDFAGAKNFKTHVTVEDGAGTKTVYIGKAAATPAAIWLGNTGFGTPSDSNFAVQMYNSQLYLNTNSTGIHLSLAGTDLVLIDAINARLDMTGLGAASGIKMKRADGTVVTLTVNNSNALVIT